MHPLNKKVLSCANVFPDSIIYFSLIEYHILHVWSFSLSFHKYQKAISTLLQFHVGKYNVVIFIYTFSFSRFLKHATSTKKSKEFHTIKTTKCKKNCKSPIHLKPIHLIHISYNKKLEVEVICFENYRTFKNLDY